MKHYKQKEKKKPLTRTRQLVLKQCQQMLNWKKINTCIKKNTKYRKKKSRRHTSTKKTRKYANKNIGCNMLVVG